PSGKSDLGRLGKRLNATLGVVSGQKPAAGKTSGDTRSYGFATRRNRTLRVALSTKKSADAISSGRIGAIVAGLAGVVVLIALGVALLRLAAGGPLLAFAGAVSRLKAGDQASRAPVKGARETRAA